MKRQEEPIDEQSKNTDLEKYEVMAISRFNAKSIDDSSDETNLSPSLNRSQDLSHESIPGAFHVRPSMVLNSNDDVEAHADEYEAPPPEEPALFLVHATAVNEDPTIYTASVVNMNGWVRSSQRSQKFIVYLIFPIILLMVSVVVVSVIASRNSNHISVRNNDIEVLEQISAAPSESSINNTLGIENKIIYGKQANGQLGTSIALSGDGSRIVIGSPSVLTTGVAQTFQLIDDQWVKLTHDIVGLEAGDELGLSVSMDQSGNRLVLGSPGKNRNIGSFSVYDFQEGKGWMIMKQTFSDDPMSTIQPRFRIGEHVALSGNGMILAGSYTESFPIIKPTLVNTSPSTSTINRTIIKTFCLDKSGWISLGQDLVGKHSADDFASSMALNDKGLVLVVGAPTAGNTEEGKAYVYGFDSDLSEWKRLGNALTGALPNSQFGFAVDISGSGNRVVVGSYAHDSGRGLTRVYEYELGSQEWVRLGKDIIGSEPGIQSGYSVAISNSGEYITVGEKGVGAAKIYHWKDNLWQLSGPVIRGDQTDDGLGYSVAISALGTRVATGAPFYGTNNSGLVNIYDSPRK